jgi:hypothetical protein
MPLHLLYPPLQEACMLSSPPYRGCQVRLLGLAYERNFISDPLENISTAGGDKKIQGKHGSPVADRSY